MTFLRYVLVQLAAYAIDMGGFLLLLHAQLAGPLVANVVSKLLAGLFAFAMHRHFTFGTGERANTVGQAWRYFLLLGLNLPLSSGLLALLMLAIPWAAAAKFIADVVIVGVTYWASKRLVFAPRKAQQAGEGLEA